MKQLTCEMCGSTNLLKEDGVFVCQSCGTKYSVEEAKKMMVEGTVEVVGTVKVDNSDKIDNYLRMAQSAMDSSNNKEAEEYCNKIIEMDVNNYQAWLLKGKAAGWQSTIQNSRLSESASAFAKAIEAAPEEKKAGVIEESKAELTKLSNALITLRGNRFAKFPDKEEANGFSSDIASILRVMAQFIIQTKETIAVSELTEPFAQIINRSVVNAFKNKILPDYNGNPNDPDDKPNKYDWQRFIERVGHCTALIEQAIKLCDNDDESDIQRYENLIFLHNQAIDSCSWDYDLNNGRKIWRRDWHLTDEAKASRRRSIAGYEAKIAEIKKAIAQKKQAAKEAYWKEHADEKASLEREKAQLDAECAPVRQQIAALQSAVDELNAGITALEQQKKGLGLFKGKEKAAIQEQIDALKAKAGAAEAKRSSETEPLTASIAEKEARIKEIETTLENPPVDK